jgi:L-alanine-DL-glutamate epimerase-like enolase superfamily enzyme
MTTRIRLLAASLAYRPDLVLHTASSGRIATLDELYLVIERHGELAGIGEIRENVAYLTGLQPATVRAGIAALAHGLDWSGPVDDIAAQLAAMQPSAPAICRALIDTALVDWAARGKGVGVVEWFGGAFAKAHTTNQSLFISDDAQLLATAERYVERGFRKLKLRVGAGKFSQDCNRLAQLRDRLGATVELAIDANGAWTLAEATNNLETLARFNVAYAEQPIAAGDWQAASALAQVSPIPIMLDEGLATPGDIERVIDAGGKLWAHLKIIKLGGITPTIRNARRLAAAGIPFMIGQMNEGGGATAAAYHCALATRPLHAELYGADGLINDPVRGVSYGHGTVSVAPAPGLGVSIDTRALATLWEIQS